MPNHAMPLVPVLTLVAAMGGGAVGAAVVQPGPAQTQAARDLTAVTEAIGDLRQAVARLEVDRPPLAQPVPRLEHQPDRQEVVKAEPAELPELDELRRLVSVLQEVVEGGIPAMADPPPISAFHTAPPLDGEAVEAARTGWAQPGRSWGDDLMYVPYPEVLARFGRPSHIDSKGRWVYRASRQNGLLLTMRDGHVTMILGG